MSINILFEAWEEKLVRFKIFFNHNTIEYVSTDIQVLTSTEETLSIYTKYSISIRYSTEPWFYRT